MFERDIADLQTSSKGFTGWKHDVGWFKYDHQGLDQAGGMMFVQVEAEIIKKVELIVTMAHWSRRPYTLGSGWRA